MTLNPPSHLREQFPVDVTNQNDKKSTNSSPFDKAASQYDQYAFAQQDIRQTLLSALLPNVRDKHTLLDIGCGPGSIAKAITETSFKKVRFINLDLSHAMLSTGKQKCGEFTQSSSYFIQGDMHSIPIQSGSVDWVVSSMAMQWSNSTEQTAAEISRIMKNGGQAELAIMIEPSFDELRTLWYEIAGSSRINSFYSQNTWSTAFRQQGLRVVKEDIRKYRYAFSNVTNMLKSIKQVGASTVTSTASRSFLRPELKALDTHYQQNNKQPELEYWVAHFRLQKD